MTAIFQAPPDARPGCELCSSAGGSLIWTDSEWRVIRIKDADFPAFYRVVHHRHVGEFSQLHEPQRLRCMQLVSAVERCLLAQLRPTKINLAALGNMVPHLHWHVIARFDWDSHFPQPIWGIRQRELDLPAVERLAVDLATLDAAAVSALDAA
jgi:diadenosine tetraphosphate (Ap4A) HIT family hydrolase